MSNKYLDQKAGGTVVLALKPENNDYVLQTRKWDPNTGTEIEPQEQLLSLTMLRQQHANLASEMDDVAALIADLEAFVEENPVAPVVVIAKKTK